MKSPIKATPRLFAGIFILIILGGGLSLWLKLRSGKPSTSSINSELIRGVDDEQRRDEPQAVAAASLRSSAVLAMAPSQPVLGTQSNEQGATPQFNDAGSGAATFADIQQSILSKMKTKVKIFKTAAEEQELLQMARDPAVFKLSASYLRNDTGWNEPEFEEAQNDLVDLFKMGFAENNPEAFDQALSLIADARIEDKEVSIQNRTILAGIQAELIYQLLAHSPSQQSAVKQATQGPVHERLLQNVTEQLEANYQDSLLEKNEHERALSK